jgi:AcrR family transcriptional regulator
MPWKSLKFDAETREDVVPYRKPTQARGRAKFEGILDAAHSLVVEQGIGNFGMADVVERAEVATGSAYHFFPNLEAIFIALVERYDAEFAKLVRLDIDVGDVKAWSDIIELQFEKSREFMNANPPAMTLIIGPGRSWQSRVADTVAESAIAHSMVDTLERFFVLPQHPPPEQLLQLCIQILNGIWELSVQRHGRVTKEFERETVQVVCTYLRSYWPQHLDRRDPND